MLGAHQKTSLSSNLEDETTVEPSSNLTTLIERLVREEVQRVFQSFLDSAGLASLMNSNDEEYLSHANRRFDNTDAQYGKYRKNKDDFQEYEDDKEFRDRYGKPQKYSSRLSFQVDRQTERPSLYYGQTRKPAVLRNSNVGYNARPTYSSSLEEYDYSRNIDSDILAYLKSFI